MNSLERAGQDCDRMAQNTFRRVLNGTLPDRLNTHNIASIQSDLGTVQC
jgi:hypothetical protein